MAGPLKLMGDVTASVIHSYCQALTYTQLRIIKKKKQHMDRHTNTSDDSAEISPTVF